MTEPMFKAYQPTYPISATIARQILSTTGLRAFFESLFSVLMRGLCQPFVSDPEGKAHKLGLDERDLLVWEFFDSIRRYPFLDFEVALILPVTRMADELGLRCQYPFAVTAKVRQAELGITETFLSSADEGFEETRLLESAFLTIIIKALQLQLPADYGRKPGAAWFPDPAFYADPITEELLAHASDENSVVYRFLLICADLILRARSDAWEYVIHTEEDERLEKQGKAREQN